MVSRSLPTNAASDGDPLVHRAIGQGLGQMDTADILRTVEVCDGAGDLQCAVEAAGGEAHAVGRIAQKRRSAGVRPRRRLDDGRGRVALRETSSSPSAA